MAAICHTPIQGTRLRVTRLNGCGEIVTGACATAVSDGFISVRMTDDVETPDEWSLTRSPAGGCVNRKVRPLINRIETEITLCAVDPELINLMTGAPSVSDGASDSVGFGVDDEEYGSASFALELWTGIAGSDACSGNDRRYGYLLLPWLTNAVFGDVDVENSPQSLTIATETVSGNSWGVGPYDVVHDLAGTPSRLLVEIPATRHRHWQVTTLAPPEPSCGCVALTP